MQKFVILCIVCISNFTARVTTCQLQSGCCCSGQKRRTTEQRSFYRAVHLPTPPFSEIWSCRPAAVAIACMYSCPVWWSDDSTSSVCLSFDWYSNRLWVHGVPTRWLKSWKWFNMLKLTATSVHRGTCLSSRSLCVCRYRLYSVQVLGVVHIKFGLSSGLSDCSFPAADVHVHKALCDCLNNMVTNRNCSLQMILKLILLKLCKICIWCYVTLWSYMMCVCLMIHFVVSHFHLFPKSFGEILHKFSARELHLSLTQGRWRHESWGYPVVDASPGAELWVWFMESQTKWVYTIAYSVA